MTGNDRLRRVGAERAAAEGLTESHAAMLAILLEVLALACYVPVELRRAVVDACRRWYVGLAEGESLEPMRVECWNYLQHRNGDSTTVADQTDLVVRGLICVLYDEAPALDDIEMTFDYFGGLLDRLSGEARPSP